MEREASCYIHQVYNLFNLLYLFIFHIFLTFSIGAGLATDKAHGQYASTVIYEDDNEEQMKSIPVTNPHRDVDTYIFAHTPNTDVAIVAPTNIFGRSQYYSKAVSLIFLFYVYFMYWYNLWWNADI